jgi:hypothetical protein
LTLLLFVGVCSFGLAVPLLLVGPLLVLPPCLLLATSTVQTVLRSSNSCLLIRSFMFDDINLKLHQKPQS